MSNKVEYVCTKCNQTSTLNRLKRRVLKDLIYEYYFVCSKCKHEHIAYYTNQKIRRDIKRQQKRRQKYIEQLQLHKSLQDESKIRQSDERLREMMTTIKRNDKLIKNKMDGLKKRVVKSG